MLMQIKKCLPLVCATFLARLSNQCQPQGNEGKVILEAHSTNFDNFRSFSRTAVNSASGVKTTLSGIYCGGLVLLVS